jgi:hypothetical protein
MYKHIDTHTYVYLSILDSLAREREREGEQVGGKKMSIPFSIFLFCVTLAQGPGANSLHIHSHIHTHTHKHAQTPYIYNYMPIYQLKISVVNVLNELSFILPGNRPSKCPPSFFSSLFFVYYPEITVEK